MEKIYEETIVGLMKRQIITSTEAGTPRGYAEAALLSDSLSAFFNLLNGHKDLRQAVADKYTRCRKADQGVAESMPVSESPKPKRK